MTYEVSPLQSKILLKCINGFDIDFRVKYISVKLLHDSSGLPYVKDRFLSCAARTLERISKNPLERISKNPLVEESITFNRVNPAWDRFLTPLSVIRLVSL